MSTDPELRSIYELNSIGFWTGQSRQIGPRDGQPPSWIERTVSPPTTPYDSTLRGWIPFEQGWILQNLPQPSLAEQKAIKAAMVDELRQSIITSGFARNFSETYGIKILQTRESDQANWLTLQTSCLSACISGQGATVGVVIRTADNTNISMSFSDALQLTLAMAAWGSAVYARSWSLKDAITAAPDQATLEAIDLNTGWPVNP